MYIILAVSLFDGPSSAFLFDRPLVEFAAPNGVAASDPPRAGERGRPGEGEGEAARDAGVGEPPEPDEATPCGLGWD